MVVKGVLKMAANEMSARSENNRNYLTVCVCVCWVSDALLRNDF